MDCFGLGGILINEEDVSDLLAAHKAFCESWKIDYPLHSHAIRGGRGNFSWLKNPEKAVEFYSDLEQFLINLPVIGIAAVIDRPGYVARYNERYEGKPWLMDKTAYVILIERAAKYAKSRNRKLRVFYEESGRDADRALVAFTRELKKTGMPFADNALGRYGGLSAQDFKDLVRGEPRRRKKSTPMLQVADLYLYPMAKAGYDPDYRAYRALYKAGKIIDAILEESARPLEGIKYSCFESIPHKKT